MNAILNELKSVDLRFESKDIYNYTAEIETDTYYIVAECEVLGTEYIAAEPEVGVMFPSYYANDIKVTITAIYGDEGEEIKGDFSEIEAYLSRNIEIDLREAI